MQAGSGMDAYFNATYLAKDGAQIVINISYRLGILGWFLNIEIPKIKRLDAQYATFQAYELTYAHYVKCPP